MTVQAYGRRSVRSSKIPTVGINAKSKCGTTSITARQIGATILSRIFNRWHGLLELNAYRFDLSNFRLGPSKINRNRQYTVTPTAKA